MPERPTHIVLPSEGGPVGGVHNPRRLAAVMRAELHGHQNDPDLDAVVSTLRMACRVPIAVVNIVTSSRQTYAAEVGVGVACTDVPDELSFCAEVVDSGRPMYVPDARSHPVYSQNPMVQEGVVASYAGVPLVDDGFVLGSVSIFDAVPREFTADELAVLRHQGRLASSVLALRRSASTDGLTGLPNQALFLDRLRMALERQNRHPGLTAVMYLDLDGFKDINDSMGHHTGDRLLAELARRLTTVVRPSDTLGRLGGDEFAAVCEEVADRRAAEQLATRMVTAASAPWVAEGRLVPIGISLGLAMADTAGADPAELLRAADAAMYDAKRTGGGWVVAAERRVS